MPSAVRRGDELHAAKEAGERGDCAPCRHLAGEKLNEKAKDVWSVAFLEKKRTLVPWRHLAAGCSLCQIYLY